MCVWSVCEFVSAAAAAAGCCTAATIGQVAGNCHYLALSTCATVADSAAAAVAGGVGCTSISGQDQRLPMILLINDTEQSSNRAEATINISLTRILTSNFRPTFNEQQK